MLAECGTVSTWLKTVPSKLSIQPTLLAAIHSKTASSISPTKGMTATASMVTETPMSPF